VIYENASPEAGSETVANSSEPEPSEYAQEPSVGEGSTRTERVTGAIASTTQKHSEASVSAMQRIVSEYLTLGDRAFHEGRFSDAVYAYAKAVEAAPNDAVAHLILSDALFATGDYHYCAYALRKAIELDPHIIDGTVDKHAFYNDPNEFDRQLGLLESYLRDHFVDDDARLVLAANYLFANRPSQAADLLESAFSLAVRETLAGQSLLKRARVASQPYSGPR
jgi:tetratricopeptide (TPR) repeat protein